MERVGGIFAYDFSDIDNITFADYTNNRNFSLVYNDSVRPPEAAGDIGPEQMRWIDGDIYGEPLLVVSNPQSASVTMYRIDCGETPVIDTSISRQGACPVISTPSSTEVSESDGEKKETLTTLEIVAIGVGSFAVLSIIVLVSYIICKRRKSGMEVYRYSSMNEFGNTGNFSNGRASGHYFELEK